MRTAGKVKAPSLFIPGPSLHSPPHWPQINVQVPAQRGDCGTSNEYSSIGISWLNGMVDLLIILPSTRERPKDM